MKKFIKVKRLIISFLLVFAIFAFFSCSPEEVEAFSDGYREGYEWGSSFYVSECDTINIVDESISID